MWCFIKSIFRRMSVRNIFYYINFRHGNFGSWNFAITILNISRHRVEVHISFNSICQLKTAHLNWTRYSNLWISRFTFRNIHESFPRCMRKENAKRTTVVLYLLKTDSNDKQINFVFWILRTKIVRAEQFQLSNVYANFMLSWKRYIPRAKSLRFTLE